MIRNLEGSLKRHPKAAPCIAKARALLDAINPVPSDLEAAIAAVEAHAAEAEATIARLDGERPDVVASGTLADLDAHDARVDAAAFARDQAAELTARLKLALGGATLILTASRVVS